MKKTFLPLVFCGVLLLSMCIEINATQSTTVFAASKFSAGDSKPDKTLQTKFAAISKATVTALKSKDFKKLAALSNPKKGIVFSSGCYLGNGDYAILTTKQLLAYSKGKDKSLKFAWGMNAGSGEDVVLSFIDFHKRYLSTPDYLAKNITVSYGTMKTVGSDPTDYLKKFPKSTAVMYYYPGTADNGNMDWKAMLLIYQEDGEKKYLAAVLHGEFTP